MNMLQKVLYFKYSIYQYPHLTIVKSKNQKYFCEKSCIAFARENKISCKQLLSLALKSGPILYRRAKTGMCPLF